MPSVFHPISTSYSYDSGASNAPGHAAGIAKIPGKGDGTKDTVDAKLAPGEAVLNKAAAEGVGRGLIAHLNAQGAAKMGMVPATAQEQAGSSHAKGTAKVSASKKEPLLTPQMLQMLMQMQGGGAGAPGGGGGILTAAPQAQQLGMP